MSSWLGFFAVVVLRGTFKILDRDKTEIVYNGGWFKQMGFSDVVKLCGRVTRAGRYSNQA